MNRCLSVSFAACLILLTGCDNQNRIVESEKDINKLIETHIKDNCIYQNLDPVNNLSFNTVEPSETSSENNNYHVLSIEEGNEKLLKQAKALEKIGLLIKSSNHVIKDSNKDIYYSSSYFSPSVKNNSIEVEKLKGVQFKVTLKGKNIIKKLYDTENNISLCVGNTEVGNITVTELSDTRFKVLAELAYQNSFDWVSDKEIVAAFGDLTEGVYDNSLAGLIEAYVIKTKNGYILENGRLNTVK